MVGMADGYAQATGRPTHVNLHTAPGVGNAVGGIGNALANKAPLVITAGQQVRAQVTHQALLTNRDATVGPQPYVKWSHEPPRAQDVPGAIGRAIHHATLPPRGPAFVSIPMDDWDAEADEDRALQRAAPRGDRPGACPTRRELAQLASAARVGAQPGAGRGPRHRRERRMAGRGRARREAATAGVGFARYRRAAGSGSRRAIRTSSASCRRRSVRSRRRWMATT